jgi:hypothetical protein
MEMTDLFVIGETFRTAVVVVVVMVIVVVVVATVGKSWSCILCG